jgi:hypothetical protein
MGVLPQSSRLLADTPATWQNPPPMSTLHALLLFVGVPAALFVGITLLVMAPSIVRGPRYRPGQHWYAEPEWFGAPREQVGSDGQPVAQIAGVDRAAPDGAAEPEGGGGASARW